MHSESSPYKGKEVKIKQEVQHPQFPTFGGQSINIEDWFDRLEGKSWKECLNRIGVIVYELRTEMYGLPRDDEVLYGHTKDGLGHLVHITEIEG